MSIEINTLYHVSVTVSVLLGLLLIYNWWLHREAPALAWWGAGFLTVSVGLALLAARGALHDVLSIVAANAVLFLGTAFWWTGARVFDGKKPHLALMGAGAILWVALCLVPAFYGAITVRVVAASSILGIYTLAAAYELWHGRAVPLLTRWPAIVLLVFHGGLFFVRIALALLAPLEEGLPGAGGGWFVFLHYEIILYEIALAFSFFALARERSSGQKVMMA
jgi:hypothetical protein